MTCSLRRQRLAVVAGFLAVAIGWIGYTTAVWNHSVPAVIHADVILGIASTAGYAVLAAAAWSWLKWIESSPIPLPGMSRVLSLFALGNLLLAVGLAAVDYDWAREAIMQPYDGRTVIVAASSYGFEFFGFLLVSAAFWSASSAIRSVRPGSSLPEDELVPA